MTYPGCWSIQWREMYSKRFQDIFEQMPGNIIQSFFHKYQSQLGYTDQIIYNEW